jgi:hypothetical protein
MVSADLEFFFDVVCPFSWQTSRWVEEVRRERRLTVRWRPVSLAVLNEGEDPDGPLGRLHRQGHRLQRVVVAAEAAHGPEVLGPLYTALGRRIWAHHPPATPGFDAAAAQVAEELADGALDIAAALREADLPAELEAAQREEGDGWDAVLRTTCDEVADRAGGDVGTPVLSFEPPDGPAFFGPVIARPPTGRQAVAVWEAVATLARLEGFAEFKRQHKDLPDVPRLRNA